MRWIQFLALGAFGSFVFAAQDCKNKYTCSNCIQTTNCMWCGNPGNLIDGDKELDRCVNRQGSGMWSWRDICGYNNIYNPENYFAMLENYDLTAAGVLAGSSAAGGAAFSNAFSESDIVQLKPQRVALKLRVQDSYSMQVTYHQALELFKEEYQMITSKVELKDNATKPVNISYFSKCGGLVEKETSGCKGLGVGDKVDFRLEVTVGKCPDNRNEWNQIIGINPVGLRESLIINLEMLCDCQCEREEDPGYQPNADACNGQGTLVCGVCACDEGFSGNECISKYKDSEGSLTMAGDLISSFYRFGKEVFNNSFIQFFKDITNHMKKQTPF